MMITYGWPLKEHNSTSCSPFNWILTFTSWQLLTITLSSSKLDLAILILHLRVVLLATAVCRDCAGKIFQGQMQYVFEEHRTISRGFQRILAIMQITT